jgi:hypothetical protein
MPSVKKKINFFETEQGTELAGVLERMTLDVAFNTEDSYTADVMRYPDNKMPFLDKHRNYIAAHPDVNPLDYVANLRLKTRLR